MKFLGNLIWLVFGGVIIAIEYLIGSIILMLTIVQLSEFLLDYNISNLQQ
jgi:uncharacterized membrane protein YccF (DUF307 family)